MQAIQKNGAAAAVRFCNEKAIPLTSEMAKKYKAKIKRVSDRSRNKNNRATAEEMKYIARFKDDVIKKVESKPIVITRAKQVHFYYPIQTNSMCLQCHGRAEQISVEALGQIKKLYPQDQAVGYSENEIRGIWSITFKKE
jgi:hypothetical protein